MPDLETLLRDVRPTPDPAFTARLDAKAAAGFPRRRRAPRLRAHFAALSLATATAAGLVLIVVLIGRHVQTGGDDSATTASAPSEAARDAAGGSAAAPMSPERRAVLRNASLTLSTTPGNVEKTADRAISITDALGGYVASSSTDMSGDHASAQLQLKLPTDQLDTGLAQLSKLAHVKARSQQAQDVTDQRSTLEARVRDARADRDGLRARLRKAATDAERAKLRAKLDRATRRVTSAERDVARINRDTSYATVDLAVEGTREPAAAVPGGRWTPGDALKDAGRVLEVIAGVALIALAILIPVAILAAPTALAGRALTRRRRERALQAS
ncbi:MAG TPA: DUF4349 domain-containing protein [Solirubrobacter sp.]|nr:DUF4349 domain-containing protein [Solirubrobacter sp.]